MFTKFLKTILFISITFIVISCEPDEVEPPIKANFSFSGTPCEAPCNITFTSLSTGNILSYSWDFGDGTGNSTDENPVYTYTTAGSYTVTLIVTAPNQTADTMQTVLIEMPPANAEASFSIANDNCLAPCDIIFTNTSTGSFDTYSWDFGDGSPLSIEENPIHNYTMPGQYTVRLTASGPNVSDDSTQIVTIEINPPVANFSFQNNECLAPCTIDFSSTSSGMIDSLRWDFGDGNSSNLMNPSHTFTQGGKYGVSLTAFGNSLDSTKIDSIIIFTPVDTVTGTLFNQGGPFGTGGINLITGEGQHNQEPDNHILDAGINITVPQDINWIQKIRPANGSDLRIADPNLDFDQLLAKEEIEAAFNQGQSISLSDVVEVGDVFIVYNPTISSDQAYIAFRVTSIVVTTTDNNDRYVFEIKN